jgi:predicted alpha/beta superfamily hydrolase
MLKYYKPLHMKFVFPVLILMLFFMADIFPQDGYTVRKDSLQSVVLRQCRHLSVYLPEGYDTSKTGFPVIYVLDGDGRCQHIVPTARFLFLNGKMPKAIVVGVTNRDRNHDFLPDSSLYAPTGGGADLFIRFFKEELIPYVENHFRTDSIKVLIGHSYGGLFAIHALLCDPGLFNDYIAIDPSCWYKDKMIVGEAVAGFSRPGKWKTSLFITGREGQGMQDMGITAFGALLQKSAPGELDWRITAYPDEDHGSVTFKSAYDGLRILFEPGNFQVVPQSGIIPKGHSAWVSVQNANSGIRYTVNGTEPAAHSEKAGDWIELKNACTLKVKHISTLGNSGSAEACLFTMGKFEKGLKTVNSPAPGLRYSYYEGGWDSTPDLSSLQPLKTGISDDVDLKMAGKKDSFAVRYEGYIHITRKDVYTFVAMTDGNLQAEFNNRELLSTGSMHKADRIFSRQLPLDPGYYPLKLIYTHKTGKPNLIFHGTLLKANTELKPLEHLFFHGD